MHMFQQSASQNGANNYEYSQEEYTGQWIYLHRRCFQRTNDISPTIILMAWSSSCVRTSRQKYAVYISYILHIHCSVHHNFDIAYIIFRVSILTYSCYFPPPFIRVIWMLSVCCHTGWLYIVYPMVVCLFLCFRLRSDSSMEFTYFLGHSRQLSHDYFAYTMADCHDGP